MRIFSAFIFIVNIFLSQIFLVQSYGHIISSPPVHQYIAREATKVWRDIPKEIIDHSGKGINSSLDVLCFAKFDSDDDIIIGSGEEDQEDNPFHPLCRAIRTITSKGQVNTV